VNHIPDNLKAQLAAARKRLWLVETLVAVLGGVCGLVGTYLLLFVSDRFWETPTWLRFLWTAAGMIGAGAWAVWWTARWRWREDTHGLARLVQRRFPKLGDRLLGIIELSDTEHLPPHVSQGLVRAAMAQVAAEAAKLDFTAAVPTRGLRRWMPLALVATALAVAALVAMPSAARNAWARWLRPISPVERFTFARLEKLPPKQVVPWGEDFAVEARLRPDSEWKPSQGRARVERQMPVTAKAEADRYRFALTGQTKSGRLVVAVGDAQERTTIEPVFRPDLAALTAEVELPGYLGYPKQTVDVRKGALDLVEGSRVTFSGRASRVLREVRLLHGASSGTVSVRGDQFVTASLELAGVTNVVLAWCDQLGLEGRQPFTVKLDWRTDTPPTVDFQGLQRVVGILEDEVLEFELLANDDFGVKEAVVIWEFTELAETEVAKQGRYHVADGGFVLRTLRAPVKFAPRVLGIGPGRVTLRAAATDYFPDRPPSVSSPYTVFVLSKEDHAKLLEQALEKLVGKLEETVRTEEAQADTSHRLREQSDEELKSSKTTQELREEKQMEQANREAVEQLTRELEKLSREAMRNNSIPAQRLKECAEIMQMLQKLAQNEMPQAQQALQNAEQTDQPQPRRDETGKAESEQQAALQKLKEALQQMNRSGEQLVAENFINRLLGCAKYERDIGAGMTELLPQTVGMRREDLPADVRGKVEAREAQQRETQKRLQAIAQDMEYYVRRVPEPAVKTVREEMEQKNVIEQLGNLADLIRDNRLAQAQESAGQWAKQLTAWAESLKKKSGTGGGGGGGEGEIPPELLELLVKLMRIRQQEQELREQTRLLDETKEANRQYPERANDLARWQAELRDRVVAAPEEVKLPAEIARRLDRLFDAVVAAMADARQLLAKPDTGGETVGAETEVIELLSATIEQSSQNASSKSGSHNAQMQALMQMLQRMAQGSQSGQRPGGNWTGGNTDAASPATSGSAGTGRGRRDVEKTSGHDTAAWPVEFRDALEGYFNAMEGDGK